jgi:hypothetical protein
VLFRSGSVMFEGDFTLSSDIIEKLTAAGRVNYTIMGTIEATARYSWVRKGRTEPINLSSDANFLSTTTPVVTTSPVATTAATTTAAK